MKRQPAEREEESGQESHNPGPGYDEEQTQPAVVCPDRLGQGGHQGVVDDVAGEEEGVDEATVFVTKRLSCDGGL